jgi:sugar diacid utilization regulator
LVAAGIVTRGRELCAYVFRTTSTGDATPGGDLRSTLRRAIRQSTEARTGVPAALAFTDAGVFALVDARTDGDPSHRQLAAERIIAEMERLDPSLGRRIHAGVGTVVDDPESIATSFDRAVAAERAAERDGERAVVWDLRPLDALIDAVVVPEVPQRSIPPFLLTLPDDYSEELLRTVECFLDEAGSVARVSARLHLHRTTVYYRLRLFEKEAGVSLDSGHDRLLLHLWMTVRRRISLK